MGTQWPSAKMGNIICDRLKEKGFQFPFHHEIFYPASHILNPVETSASKKKLRFVYLMERKHQKECDKARERALQMSLDWIERL